MYVCTGEPTSLPPAQDPQDPAVLCDDDGGPAEDDEEEEVVCVEQACTRV